MTSYHAATAYIKSTQLPTNDMIIVGPQLALFGQYFSSVAECEVIEPHWTNMDYWSFLSSFSPREITYWGYALSDIALLTVHYARRHKISINIVLPAPVGDDLYHCNDFELHTLLRNWRSLPRVFLHYLRGWPLQLKTFNNYVYECIDARLVASVKTFKELSSGPNYSNERYAEFAEYVRCRYPDVLEALTRRPKSCIFLDEDLDFYEKRLGVAVSESLSMLGEVLDALYVRGWSVHLKPSYHGQPYLSRHFSFTSIISGEIPLQVIDLLVRKGTVVTGWSSSFLQEPTKNLRSVGINDLALSFMHCGEFSFKRD